MEQSKNEHFLLPFRIMRIKEDRHLLDLCDAYDPGVGDTTLGAKRWRYIRTTMFNLVVLVLYVHKNIVKETSSLRKNEVGACVGPILRYARQEMRSTIKLPFQYFQGYPHFLLRSKRPRL